MSHCHGNRDWLGARGRDMFRCAGERPSGVEKMPEPLRDAFLECNRARGVYPVPAAKPLTWWLGIDEGKEEYEGATGGMELPYSDEWWLTTWDWGDGSAFYDIVGWPGDNEGGFGFELRDGTFTRIYEVCDGSLYGDKSVEPARSGAP